MRGVPSFLMHRPTRGNWTAAAMTLGMVPGLALAQTPVDGNTVQAQLDAAINAGQSSYTLPNAPILLTKTLQVSPRARNFTITGGPNTQLIRNTNSDFNMLVVGSNTSIAFSNTELASFPSFAVAPAVEGAAVLSVPTGIVVPNGWYVIAGLDPINDIVRISAGTAFAHRRELIRVTGQSGTSVFLDRPLSRDFATPGLYQIEVDGINPAWRRVANNITIRNVRIQGRVGGTFGDRSATPKGAQVTKAMVVSLADGTRLENVSVSGFSNSGINLLVCRDTIISNATITDGNVRSLGYGIEVAASRGTTVVDSSFQDTRLAVMFQAGSTDGYVLNCVIPPGRGGFDVGHGQDERRITYELCRADSFTIGNRNWMRGGKDLRLVNCTAYQVINVFGAVRNLTIEGRHPDFTITTPTLNLRTEINSAGFPTGPVWPESVTLRNVILNNPFVPGRALQVFSSSGTPPRLPSLLIEGSTIVNPVSIGVNALDFGDLAGNANVVIRNTTIQSTASTFPTTMGGTTTVGGFWDVTYQNCVFLTPNSTAIRLDAGHRGIHRVIGGLFNGSAITPSRLVDNASDASFTFAP